ncbi:cupin domain-containing protein [Undibacterium sp. SXout7W]|uniref:cupin domain-containing protein n=1 Tax=Undibacterium sp. SXout7W TaxID=3413049 RepID=UPI003BF3DBC7
MKTKVLSGMTGIALTLAAIGSYEALRHVNNIAPASSSVVSAPVQPFEVDPSWVKEGTPNFRATEFFKSSDNKTSSGIFECDASTFEWHYQLDEAVYILEGAVEIDYQGKKLHLKPGDTAFFRAGTTALWHVPQHIKKTWTLYDAGKPARALATLLKNNP